MASQAQCFYCFECLSASFENRDPLALSKVEGLWGEYQKSLLSENESSSEQPEERPLEEDSAMEDTEDTDGEESPDEEDVDDSIVDAITDGASTSLTHPTPRPQLPSISRLQASTPNSHCSSSSTPSTLSANSSNTALTTPASSTTSISTPPSPSTFSKNRPTYSSRLTLPTTRRTTTTTITTTTATTPTTTYPLFVTWNTISRTTSHKYLRGCIGTFDALPLSSGLQTYALTSAFEDTRFSPVPHSLLPSLSCSLTLLADFETCTSPLDWSVGTHGLRITFIHRGKRYGATYLPDVAVEQGWSKEETLESLMRKAGWDGGGSNGGGSVARRFLRGGRDRYDGIVARQARSCWEEVSDFRTIRYTGLKASASYSEWREWRRWVEENHGKVLR